MAKESLKSLVKFGKGTALFAVILFAIFSPFFLIIRKEKMIREYSQKREKLSSELLKLKSETASLELSIGQLNSAERLEKFAMDSLGMAPADPRKVIVVQRGKDGAIVLDKKKNDGFLYKLMGKE